MKDMRIEAEEQETPGSDILGTQLNSNNAHNGKFFGHITGLAILCLIGHQASGPGCDFQENYEC